MSTRKSQAFLLTVTLIAMAPLVRAGESDEARSKQPVTISDLPEDERLAAIIEQIEANEALYKNIEVRIRTQYDIGDSASFVCLGCVISVNRAAKSDREMKGRIIALVPVGTPIAEARQKMEENGFRCSSEQNGENEPGKLQCRIDKSMNLLVSTTWVADLSYDERGLVTEVAIRSWDTGP